MITKIKNCKVLNADFSDFFESNIYIENGKITRISKENLNHNKEIDARKEYVIPGFVDIHTHGSYGYGYAVSDKPDFQGALEWSCRKGITTVIPTISTFSIDETISYAKNINLQAKKSKSASIRGIHFEGPFISPGKKGAMINSPESCTIEAFDALVKAAEKLPVTMTVAPELENALDVIKHASDRGVRISLGHSLATYEEAMAGIKAGATGATHTFNAMRAYDHREPGILGAVLTEPSVSCEVICDMVHLALPTVKIIYAAKGVDKMIIVSDSGEITGLGDGEYFIRGHLRIVKDGVCRIPEGNIAGSCFTMIDGAKNLIKAGFSLAEVAKMASYNPARAMKIDNEVGSVEEGKIADLLLVNSALDVLHVIKDGEIFN